MCPIQINSEFWKTMAKSWVKWSEFQMVRWLLCVVRMAAQLSSGLAQARRGTAGWAASNLKNCMLLSCCRLEAGTFCYLCVGTRGMGHLEQQQEDAAPAQSLKSSGHLPSQLASSARLCVFGLECFRLFLHLLLCKDLPLHSLTLSNQLECT